MSRSFLHLAAGRHLAAGPHLAARSIDGRPIGALLGAALCLALGACENVIPVQGSFPEVWDRSQVAMQRARFETAGYGAMHQEIRKDRSAGTLHYIWSQGDLFPVRVVDIRIDPPEWSDAQDHHIHIDAWEWGLFGWMKQVDNQAIHEARVALEKEFGTSMSAAQIAAIRSHVHTAEAPDAAAAGSPMFDLPAGPPAPAAPAELPVDAPAAPPAAAGSAVPPPVPVSEPGHGGA